MSEVSLDPFSLEANSERFWKKKRTIIGYSEPVITFSDGWMIRESAQICMCMQK